MTLAGVLKDILLVAASMLIFGDPVSPLQMFGYTIALCGLVYYKLGADKMKEYLGQGQRAWADYGVRHPAMRRIVTFALVIVTLLMLLGGITASGAVPQKYDPTPYATAKFNEVLGSSGKTGA